MVIYSYTHKHLYMNNDNKKQNKINPCGHTDQDHEKMFGGLPENFDSNLIKIVALVNRKYGQQVKELTARHIKDLESRGLTTRENRNDVLTESFAHTGSTFTEGFMAGVKFANNELKENHE